jgi:hypothetical protein
MQRETSEWKRRFHSDISVFIVQSREGADLGAAPCGAASGCRRQRKAVECLQYGRPPLRRNGNGHKFNDKYWTLVLDIYDPTTKQLVWTGALTNTQSQQRPGKEPKESGQGYRKVVEGLPAPAEEVVRDMH